MGSLEVISGCMFSGKTEELLRQLKRAKIAKQIIQVFKPALDTRYGKERVATHDKESLPAVPVTSAQEILNLVQPKTHVVGIDESQFFDSQILDVVETLANSHFRVIVAGLDTDYLGRPFGSMPQLLAKADLIRKQYAICMICGDAATRTQRLIKNSDAILLGSQDSYEARCRKHFDPELNKSFKVSMPRHENKIPLDFL